MMNENAVLDELQREAIIPVLVLDDARRARDLALTLQDAGIRTAEVTLRTPAALEAIQRMADVDDFLVGAGTVLNGSDVDGATAAGARYVISPGFDRDSWDRARHRGVPYIPGVATPSEAQHAHAVGLTRLKVFPAELLGGIAFIDALSGPFPSIRFLPSGGVTPENAAIYLSHPSVFAVSGSWMVPRAAIRDGDFSRIAALASAAVNRARTR